MFRACKYVLLLAGLMALSSPAYPRSDDPGSLIATTSRAGRVKPDGTSITVGLDGAISAVAGTGSVAAITSGTIAGVTISNSPISGNTGSFTTLGASSTVTLSPASAAVAISPTGTGTVTISPVGALTINPTAASTIDNVAIGGSTPLAGAFTTLRATGAGTYTGAVAFNGTKISTTAPLAASMTTNGAMTSNITGWTGANWAWNAANGGEALHTTGATTALTGTDTYVSGQSYLVTYHVILTSGTSVTMSFGGITDTARTATGTYTKWATATATTAMAFTPTSDFAGAINLVSVQAQGPAITSCGTSPSLQQGSSSIAGYVTTGSGSPTACTLTYATAFTNTPACVVTPITGVMPSITARSNAAFTTTFSATTTGFSYYCLGLNE